MTLTLRYVNLGELLKLSLPLVCHIKNEDDMEIK